jgi:hypothetical protein
MSAMPCPLDASPAVSAGQPVPFAPLFEPLDQALLSKLRSEPHWHADETRWAMFVQVHGKVGHRWYLWVFHSRSVIHYGLDESRSAEVIEAESPRHLLQGCQLGPRRPNRRTRQKVHGPPPNRPHQGHLAVPPAQELRERALPVALVRGFTEYLPKKDLASLPSP